MLTVDCAFSYLFYDLPDAEPVLRGVAGCAMGERFVVVTWNGDVYPCSHLHEKEFKMGNVLEQRFQDIWETELPLGTHFRGTSAHRRALRALHEAAVLWRLPRHRVAHYRQPAGSRCRLSL